MTRIFEQIKADRGITEAFLHPKYFEEAIYLPDIDLAVKRIKKAVKKHEKVLIYGDYDVDGVTATTLMVDTLKMAGITEIVTMLPDRFTDGYGMSERCIDRAKTEGVKLVVTVDCGSGNVEIVEKLKEAGIDTIVTDHHEVNIDRMADAVAVVNPKRPDFKASEVSEKFEKGGSKYSPEDLRELAGVGVAFMLSKALVAEGMVPRGQEKWLLDLVYIGTICDAMMLTGINRELSFYGAKVLAKTRRPGLIELIRVAKVTRMDSHSIGFLIGPRLNAAGRMESAEISLKLLTSESRAEAAVLAAKLDKLNKERKAEQRAAVDEIEERGVGDDAVIVEKGKWHEGVIGIIAGRLVERYHRPAFVLTEVGGVDSDQDGVVEKGERIFKGSGRTFGDFNLAEALKACSGEIVKGGGHAAACGLTVLDSKIEDFRRRVNEFYRECSLKNQDRYLELREDVVVTDLKEITVELAEELVQLEPFGNGNEEPVFKLDRLFVLNVTEMGAGGRHLNVLAQGEDGSIIKLVAFYAPKKWFEIPKGSVRSFLVRLIKNEWQGRITVEATILGIKGEA